MCVCMCVCVCVCVCQWFSLGLQHNCLQTSSSGDKYQQMLISPRMEFLSLIREHYLMLGDIVGTN